MSATKDLINLGKRIEKKLVITAQTISAQPDDVEQALTKAGLFGPNFDNTQVAPLLNSAGTPETVKVFIFLHIDSALNATVVVKSDPPHGSINVLKRLLQAKFGAAITKALKDAHLTVAGSLDVKWSTFT